MKKLLILSIILFITYSCNHEPQVKEHFMSFKDMKVFFKDPPATFRTVPFWVWNEHVSEEMIDEQLEDFDSKGFGGVFIHPRYGLITEYVSDEWYRLVDYAVDKAEALGMKAWLYDENSFPSGFAGGHVPAEMPESYNRGIALKMHKLAYPELDSSLVWQKVFLEEGGEMKDITEKVTRYKGKKGNYRAFELVFYEPSKWFGGFTYVDLLYEGVTEKFIEVTMEGYENTIGEQFGKTVPGIFTDEPNINPRHKNVLRWTPDLYKVFEEEWGYDLRPHLVSLMEETGDWKKIRHNYYHVLLKLFIDRWAVPWYNYTEEMNLDWTGHYWEHGWPDPVHGGDNMAMYPYHQVPGIDMLFNTCSERPDQFGNVRAVKELSSVASQFERPRALSETYGASGYELDFVSMKRNGDWEYALGVNLMNQHLSYQSMLGDRKHDFPQTFSYHTPWWDEYEVQADYFGRLSLALSSGWQVNHILVIEPTTSAWMLYEPGGKNEKMNKIGDDFRSFIEELEKYKVEYDLASEKTMRDFGAAGDKLITVGAATYDLLVLPFGLLNLDSSTLAILEDYLRSGGKVLSFGIPPAYVDGAMTNMVMKIKDEYSQNWFEAREISDPAVLELMATKELEIKNPSVSAEYVYYMRRELEDGQIVFFMNYEEGTGKNFEVTMEGMKDIIELDAEKGNFYSVPFEKTSTGIKYNVELGDAGSKLYFVSAKNIRTERHHRWKLDAQNPVSSSSTTISRSGKNALPLDYCYLDFPDIPDDGNELMYFYVAHDKIFQHYGFDDNPWVSSSQYKQDIIDLDTFGVKTGFNVTFPLEIQEETVLNDIELVIERPSLYEVMINGHEAEAEEGEWYLDKGTGVYKISDYLRPGSNEIMLVASPFSVHHELAPVIITGGFGVYPSDQGWEIGPPEKLQLGSWKEMAMPFYPGEVSYTKQFTASEGEGLKVVAGDWEGSCAKISVNGTLVKVLAWPPYEADITDFVQEGKNKVSLTVVGSLKSLVGPHHNVQRKGIVTPWSFKYAPEDQPPGTAYDLPDYGLFRDFTIFSGTYAEGSPLE